MITVGAMVRGIRKARRMTQLQLAKAAGCSRVHISYVENDRIPSPRMLSQIAAALDCRMVVSFEPVAPVQTEGV